MEKISFQYNGKAYSAQLIRSEQLLPKYYWLMPEDEELQNQFGDIAFLQNAEGIVPINQLTSAKHETLFSSMLQSLKSVLAYQE